MRYHSLLFQRIRYRTNAPAGSTLKLSWRENGTGNQLPQTLTYPLNNSQSYRFTVPVALPAVGASQKLKVGINAQLYDGSGNAILDCSGRNTVYRYSNLSCGPIKSPPEKSICIMPPAALLNNINSLPSTVTVGNTTYTKSQIINILKYTGTDTPSVVAKDLAALMINRMNGLSAPNMDTYINEAAGYLLQNKPGSQTSSGDRITGGKIDSNLQKINNLMVDNPNCKALQTAQLTGTPAPLPKGISGLPPVFSFGGFFQRLLQFIFRNT